MTRGTEGGPPPGYPPHWQADVVASDGGTVRLRPITPDDADALVAFHQRLSDRTRYLRFFGPYPSLSDRDVQRFTRVDHDDHVALIALLGHDIIAVGRYARLAADGETTDAETADGRPGRGDMAEVAFVVDDAHQGRGLGSILLEHLAAAAAERDIRRFVAEVLAENRQMLRVFRAAGYGVSRSFEEGTLHLEFDIDPTERSVAVLRGREQAAEARSVHRLLHPSSVAVIGASADPEKVGHAVLRNLLGGDFAGPVYPVNAEHRSVRGVRAYPSVLDVPDAVDLAVIAVPPGNVHEVCDQCLAKQVHALVVLTAELGDSERDDLDGPGALRTQARTHGMRVVGPNALGVVNTDRAVRLNATLAPTLPGPGRVGFFAQSGALGIALLAEAADRGLGLSTFVSAGDRTDVSGNDLLQYWQSDPGTDVVLLYLESFGNPRKFARVARRLARDKPVVAVKTGRHAVPPALAATGDPVAEASAETLFEQAGVIRVESVTQLFDTALLLAHQPLPAGGRVAIVGNSTALGLLAADTARAQGLSLAGAPVDVGPAARPDQFAAAVSEGVTRSDADALVVVYVPPVAVPGTAYASALREAVTGAGRPVVSTFLAAEGVPAELAEPNAHGAPGPGSVPSYPSPERAVLALARATRYAAWRAEPDGQFERPDRIRPRDAADLVAESLGAGAETTVAPSDEQAGRLLDCYGIAVAPFRRASGAEQALEAAAEIGYPVALKAGGHEWRRRTDLVGVRLDLTTPEAVRGAYADLAAVGPRAAADRIEVVVQRMAPKGVSCTVGVDDDPSFGPLVSFGLSGVASELLGDRAYRSLPVSDTDAAKLVRAPRAAPMLTGYRGAEPVDLDALADLVLRVATLAEDVSELRSLTLGPVLATPSGATVTDVSARLGPAPSRCDAGPRRLR